MMKKKSWVCMLAVISVLAFTACAQKAANGAETEGTEGIENAEESVGVQKGTSIQIDAQTWDFVTGMSHMEKETAVNDFSHDAVMARTTIPGYAESEELQKEALEAYQRFIRGEDAAGKIVKESMFAEDGDADKNVMQYAIVDVTNDIIPELHIQTEQVYCIFTYDNGEVVLLDATSMPEPESGESFYVLRDGALLYKVVEPNKETYCYFNLVQNQFNDRIWFGKTDVDANGTYDENDYYEIGGQSCTQGEWFMQTRAYLERDSKGREQVWNQAEWIIYCEKE